ncbi:MAG: phosphate uptake regulator PhoU [Nitrosopumilus sp.]|nr:phosphate uptake regulator PhoU [Nitrosopumilus sp.]CAI9831070.1 Phosphate uptake regulator PhoU [Nitrosopumilaceae archaeon]MDA7941163.1 phosphate uptake regulator PhoU [Nitrosopumilus sp.]MDA7942439.1 phosphate uptake regulator PhoU [Nitrosopumilus sp.]MDA7944841.1 phosphate uptake regulator PhoU [Nitrosopumilus sp.]
MAKFVRRLQRIGSSSLVSLPKEWVDSNGLGRGSQVELETGPHGVSISAGGAPPAKELDVRYPLPAEENIVAYVTGAYLLGYDVIRVSSKAAVPPGDREKIRDSTRWLVGMEIMEEAASKISMQFLLDPTALDPSRILRRMGSIALGMYEDVVRGLGQDRSGLATVAARDVEVNRQYFLLVRLIRSALVDRRLAGSFHLNTDVLDYRIAAHQLENAADHIVELARYMGGSGLAPADAARLRRAASGFGAAASKSVEAFAAGDRRLAIEAISMHGRFAAGLAALRGRGQMPVGLLDMVHMFERATRPWADMADLVRPAYGP